MNKLILSLLFSLVISSAYSQRVYFVYVQAEQEQPFYINMEEKIYSSTASGYLILSRLKDTSYSFTIGFPQGKWPVQKFTIAIKSRDHGFVLKNFGEKGWGLFDLQSLAVQMSETDKAKNIDNGKIENKDVSAFTEILAKAVDDPSLKDKPVRKEEKKPEVVVKKEEPKNEVKQPSVTKPAETNPVLVVNKEEPKSEVKQPPVTKTTNSDNQATAKKDETKTAAQETNAPVIKEVPPTTGDPKVGISQPVQRTEELKQPEQTYKRSVVTKKSESTSTEGIGVMYIDENTNGLNDTIQIVIPVSQPAIIPKKEEVKEEKKFLDISSDTAVKNDDKAVKTKPIAVEATTVKKVSTNKCAAQADQTDFLKLRKQIAGIENEDEMVAEARKYFRKKCFTVSQIKNLSSLFLYEVGKYKFFDAAYSYASDVENFASLQTELKEEYYINRFKAMLR